MLVFQYNSFFITLEYTITSIVFYLNIRTLRTPLFEFEFKILQLTEVVPFQHTSFHIFFIYMYSIKLKILLG